MSLPEFMRDDFQRFAFTADEWLVSYAHLSSSFVVVYPATFSMAMVIELYLKAYAAFLSGNGVDVTKFGHGIADLYDSLQTSDPSFPPELRIKPQLSKLPLHDLDRDGWKSGWYVPLPQAEQEDIRSNYEVYVAMAYSADLKYGVSPALPKHSGRIISSAWSRLNPWLAEFVCGIRKRIDFPSTQNDDRLSYALRHPDLHSDAKTYLSRIHGQRSNSSAGRA